MRNIFLFIRRYFTFFAFLVLQGVSLWFLFSYNRFHRAKFLGIANEFTGRVNTQFNKVEDYLYLKEENRHLHAMNDSLLNARILDFMLRDTSLKYVKDSLPFDTLGHFRRYFFRPATVVYNSVNSQKNFIQLNRGSDQGIKDNMGVLSSDGYAVGVVVAVSANFCQVMSLLNVKSTISATLKKTGEFGLLEWDGKDPRYIYMRRVPKTSDVLKGDTVMTSPYSFSIPPGYIVGTIADVKVDNATGLYDLKVKTSVNFYRLQQVHIVENLQYDEQAKLFEDTRIKTEETKKVPR